MIKTAYEIAYEKGYQYGMNKVATSVGDMLNLAFTLPGLYDSAKHYIDKAKSSSKNTIDEINLTGQRRGY